MPPSNLGHCQFQAVGIVHVLAVVEPKGLLVEVAKKMGRLATDVGSLDATFHKTPEIFQAVLCDVTSHILDRVVDDLMERLSAQSVVRCQSVTVERCASGHVLWYFILKNRLLPILDYSRANLTSR